MSSPLAESEVMLFRVLERANLTQYYEAFISQGGDDLYQLCEAGEDEFLEIMVLVGMSKKPLHVRRLQKALHEWASNPGLFQETDGQKKVAGQVGAAPKGSILAAFLQHSSPSRCASTKVSAVTHSLPSSNSHSMDRPLTLLTNNGFSLSSGNSFSQEHSFRSLHLENNLESFGDKPSSPVSENSDHDSPMMTYMNSSGEKVTTSPTASGGAQLSDLYMKKIEMTADDISQGLPYYAPKPLNMKKPIDKEIDEAMNLPEDDPSRMNLFRKYSAIYGRFDSKRRGGKRMNFHEMCINEAAAQLCKHRPSLLTRREELFILARQVVREAGFQYSKGCRSKESLTNNSVGDEPMPKMPKNDFGNSTGPQDLSVSKHKFLSPASCVSGFSDGPDREVDAYPTAADVVADYSASGGSASNSVQPGNSLTKNRVERSVPKVQQGSTPRKVLSFKRESVSEENGISEEIDEQKEWQRAVGLDSLKIATTSTREPVQNTPLCQGSSIIQALREGMKGGIRSHRINSVIKQEITN